MKKRLRVKPALPVGRGAPRRRRTVFLWGTLAVVAAGLLLGLGHWLWRQYPGERSGRFAQLPPAERSGALMTDTRRIDTNDWAALFDAGNRLLTQERFAEALSFYAAALRLAPEEAELRFNMGYACLKIGNTNAAIEHYTAALKIDPNYVEAHNNLGSIYVSLREYEQASQQFSAALRIMPEHGRTLNNMGKCLAAQGRPEEAIPYFSKAAAKNPNALEPRFNLARAFLILKRPEDAIRELSEVLRMDPEYGPAQRDLEVAKAMLAQPH